MMLKIESKPTNYSASLVWDSCLCYVDWCRLLAAAAAGPGKLGLANGQGRDFGS